MHYFALHGGLKYKQNFHKLYLFCQCKMLMGHRTGLMKEAYLQFKQAQTFRKSKMKISVFLGLFFIAVFIKIKAIVCSH